MTSAYFTNEFETFSTETGTDLECDDGQASFENADGILHKTKPSENENTNNLQGDRDGKTTTEEKMEKGRVSSDRWRFCDERQNISFRFGFAF